MKRAITIALLTLCVGGTAIPRAEAAEATCLVRISYDQRNLPNDLGYLEALLGSSGVVTVAAREVPAIESFARHNDVTLRDIVTVGFREAWYAGSAPGRVLFGHLVVEVYDEIENAERVAEQVMARVCTRLESLLTTIVEQDHRHRSSQLAAAESEVKRANAALQELRTRQRKLAERAAPYELSHRDISHDIGIWRHEKQEIELTMVALHARQEALGEQIASVAEQVEHRASDDPVLAELEKVVQVRARRLERAFALHQEGAAHDAEIGQAEEEVAMARAELAERRRNTAELAGGGLLASLNENLLGVSLELAEARARFQFLEQRLAIVADRELLALATSFESEVKPQLKAAEAALQHAMEWRLQLQQQSHTYQSPNVMILGGTDEN